MPTPIVSTLNTLPRQSLHPYIYILTTHAPPSPTNATPLLASCDHVRTTMIYIPILDLKIPIQHQTLPSLHLRGLEFQKS